VDTTSDIYIVMELVTGGELFELITLKGRHYKNNIDYKKVKQDSLYNKLYLAYNIYMNTK